YAPVDDAGERGVPDGAADAIAAVGDRAGLLVTRNGRVAHVELDRNVAANGGGVLGDVLEADDGDDLIASVADTSTDAFTALATAFVTGGALVRVPARAVVPAPLVVVHWIDRDGAAIFPRTVVSVGEDAEVTVIER